MIFKENEESEGEYEYYRVEEKQPDTEVKGIININDYEEYLDKYEFLEEK